MRKFFQRPPDSVVAGTFDDFQRYHLLFQQFQCPSGSALRRRAAGQGNEFGFGGTVEMRGLAIRRPPRNVGFQKDAGLQQLTSCMFAAANERGEKVVFIGAEPDIIFLYRKRCHSLFDELVPAAGHGMADDGPEFAATGPRDQTATAMEAAVAAKQAFNTDDHGRPRIITDPPVRSGRVLAGLKHR